ncbi:MAG: hypothetical protein ACTSP9_06560 [Promethearchaeota archaeon]
MNNGLDITEEQFMKMNSKERDLITFRNLTHIRKKLKDYSFHRKIQYTWLFVLTIALGFRKFLPL